MPSGPYSYAIIDPPYDIDTGTYRNVGVAQVNDRGQVLGLLSGSTGTQPFLYADGSYTVLAAPGANANSTSATQLSNAGQVIGRYTDAAGSHAYLYGDGTYTEIAVPGADFTTALQVSAGGKILAEYFDSAGLHPAIDDNGTFTTLSVPGASSTVVRLANSSSSNLLPAINDAGQVIGTYADAAGSHAFLYSGGDSSYTTLAVPGAALTTPTAINAAGQVLGTYGTVPGTTSGARPFVYSDGAYTTIAVPGATTTTAAQINDAGQVAGTYSDATGTHVFLETDGTYATVNPPFNPNASGSASSFFTQLTNAGDILASGPGSQPGSSQPFIASGGTSTDASVPGAATSSGTRINDLGQLIGTFFDGVTSHAFLATPLAFLAAPLGGGAAQAATDGFAPAVPIPDAAALLTPTDGGLASVPQLTAPDPATLTA